MIGRLSRFLGFLVPHDGDYFDLFEKQARVARECALVLDRVNHLAHAADDNAVAEIRDLEQKADAHTGALIRKVELAVITPIDSEDIFKLAKMMDDIIDFAEEIVIKMNAYRTKPDGAIKELLTTASKSLVLVGGGVESLRKRDSIAELRAKMKSCEHDADKLISDVIAESYKISVADVLQKTGASAATVDDIQKALDAYGTMRRRREVAELLENMVDSCEHVFHALANIYLKF